MQRGAACTGLWWPRCASFEAAAATARPGSGARRPRGRGGFGRPAGACGGAGRTSKTRMQLARGREPRRRRAAPVSGACRRLGPSGREAPWSAGTKDARVRQNFDHFDQFPSQGRRAAKPFGRRAPQSTKERARARVGARACVCVCNLRASRERVRACVRVCARAHA